MKNKLNWLEAALLVAPFLVIAAFWNKLPARLPVHWNLHGEVDRWASSKPIEIFILPLIAVGVVVLLRVVPRLDPKLRAGQQNERTPAVLQILRLTLAAFFDLIFFIQIATALNYTTAGGRAIIWGALVLLAIMGNYLGNLRPNYFIGIRTPWTLESAETWRATHRLGGRLIFFGALLLLAAEFFLSQSAFAFLFVTLIVLLVAWAFYYSWHHFRTHGATH